MIFSDGMQSFRLFLNSRLRKSCPQVHFFSAQMLGIRHSRVAHLEQCLNHLPFSFNECNMTAKRLPACPREALAIYTALLSWAGPSSLVNYTILWEQVWLLPHPVLQVPWHFPHGDGRFATSAASCTRAGPIPFQLNMLAAEPWRPTVVWKAT